MTCQYCGKTIAPEYAACPPCLRARGLGAEWAMAERVEPEDEPSGPAPAEPERGSAVDIWSAELLFYVDREGIPCMRAGDGSERTVARGAGSIERELKWMASFADAWAAEAELSREDR